MSQEYSIDLVSKRKWYRAGSLVLPCAVIILGIYVLEKGPNFAGWKPEWTVSLRWTLGLLLAQVVVTGVIVANLLTKINCDKTINHKISKYIGVVVAWSLVLTITFGLCQLFIEQFVGVSDRTNNFSLESLLIGFISMLIIIVIPAILGGVLSLGIRNIGIKLIKYKSNNN